MSVTAARACHCTCLSGSSAGKGGQATHRPVRMAVAGRKRIMDRDIGIRKWADMGVSMARHGQEHG